MKKIFMIALMFTTIIILLPSMSMADNGKTYTIKIAVETTPTHHRNIGLIAFKEVLDEISAGKVKVEIYDSGSLYKGRDIPKALRLGTLEMGVPGSWQLETIEPSVAILSLPMFSGRDYSIATNLADGLLGDIINKKLEETLKVKVLPGYYGHGHDNIFIKTRKINTIDDLKGLKIRHRGGYVYDLGLKAIGANPLMISFTDVPMALMQGTVDGVCTTYKSFESLKMWETDTKYAYECNMVTGFYIGMISQKFWNSVPDDIQNMILDAWKIVVPYQRYAAQEEFEWAEEELKKHGVNIVYPPKEERKAFRAILLSKQEEMIKSTKIDNESLQPVVKTLELIDEYDNRTMK